MTKAEESSKAWMKIVAKAWADETFKKKLLQNPNAVFAEYEVPELGRQ